MIKDAASMNGTRYSSHAQRIYTAGKSGGGFDYVKARELLGLSDEYNVEAMLAIGKPGKKEDLPEQLQEREFPSDRRQISESFFELSRWK